MWRDRTLWEIDQIRDAERAAAAAHLPAKHAAQATRNRRISGIVAEAEARTGAAADPAASKASRVAGIRENRAAEREALHKERAVVPRDRRAPEGDRIVPFPKPGAPDDDEPSIADFKAHLLSQLDDDNAQ